MADDHVLEIIVVRNRTQRDIPADSLDGIWSEYVGKQNDGSSIPLHLANDDSIDCNKYPGYTIKRVIDLPPVYNNTLNIRNRSTPSNALIIYKLKDGSLKGYNKSYDTMKINNTDSSPIIDGDMKGMIKISMNDMQDDKIITDIDETIYKKKIWWQIGKTGDTRILLIKLKRSESIRRFSDRDKVTGDLDMYHISGIYVLDKTDN